METLALPAIEMADRIGGAKSANMVALGALVGRTGLLEKESLLEVVRAMTKNAQLLELNVRAVEEGFNFARARPRSASGGFLRGRLLNKSTVAVELFNPLRDR